jgi:hypothetical protein
LKIEQVIRQLLTEFPKYSEIVSSVVNIKSINVQASNGGEMIVETESPHNLSPGQGIVTSGVKTPISVQSITRVANILQIVTTADHDLTFGIMINLTIQNCSVAEFNGSHKIVSVENRRTVRVAFTGTATSASDGEILSANRYSQSYNSLWQISSVTTPTVFVVPFANPLVGSTSVGGKVQSNISISGAVTYEIAKASYTKQQRDKGFLAVVLDTTVASKSRLNNSDLTAVISRTNWYRQQNQQTFSVFYMSNPNDEIALRQTRDNMEDVAYALDKSLLFHEFTNNTALGKSHPVVFVQHGTREYDGSFYCHEFVFESDEELNFADTTGYSNDVAFRNLNVFLEPNLSNSVDTEGTLTADAIINLDEVPL